MRLVRRQLLQQVMGGGGGGGLQELLFRSVQKYQSPDGQTL